MEVAVRQEADANDVDQWDKWNSPGVASKGEVSVELSAPFPRQPIGRRAVIRASPVQLDWSTHAVARPAQNDRSPAIARKEREGRWPQYAEGRRIVWLAETETERHPPHCEADDHDDIGLRMYVRLDKKARRVMGNRPPIDKPIQSPSCWPRYAVI